MGSFATSCNRHAGATDSLDALLRAAGEDLGLDNDRYIGQLAVAQHLEKTLHQIGRAPRGQMSWGPGQRCE